MLFFLLNLVHMFLLVVVQRAAVCWLDCVELLVPLRLVRCLVGQIVPAEVALHLNGARVIRWKLVSSPRPVH